MSPNLTDWRDVCAGASAISGFFAAACSLPFDYVKTQMQKQTPGPDGKLPYSGSLDCAMKTFAAGGPMKFYTGFGTYCIRIAPHVMVGASGRPLLRRRQIKTASMYNNTTEPSQNSV